MSISLTDSMQVFFIKEKLYFFMDELDKGHDLNQLHDS